MEQGHAQNDVAAIRLRALVNGMAINAAPQIITVDLLGVRLPSAAAYQPFNLRRPNYVWEGEAAVTGG